MKVFISWSGEKSKQVAELIDTWLQCTIQSSEPWLSSRSIDRGALWFSEIISELADTSLGIICLTKENKSKPWILFEAGAIAKGLSSSRVCTFLVDLEPAELENPLAQFNHTLYNKESLEQLLITINNLSEVPLKPAIIEKVFNKYWPEFEEKFDAILHSNPISPSIAKRPKDDVMLEILNTIRGLDKRMIRMEGKADSSGNINEINSISLMAENIIFAYNMILNGSPIEEIVSKLKRNGYGKAMINDIISQANQLRNNSSKNIDQTSNLDMLEQLRAKFGK